MVVVVVVVGGGGGRVEVWALLCAPSVCPSDQELLYLSFNICSSQFFSSCACRSAALTHPPPPRLPAPPLRGQRAFWARWTAAAKRAHTCRLRASSALYALPLVNVLVRAH